MRNVFTIIRKELRAYFVSPIAYVVLTGFLLLGGWFFFNLLSRFNVLLSIYTQLQQGAADQLNLNEFVIAPLMHNLSIVLVILVPMITMRAYAEEKKGGTYELLLTSPLRTGEIVLGKFLASFLFICIMLGLTRGIPGGADCVWQSGDWSPARRLSRLAPVGDFLCRRRPPHLVVYRKPDHSRSEWAGGHSAAVYYRLASRYRR